MDKFRDVYQEACKELPTPSMDADRVRDELRHQRMMRKRRRYMIARGCTAAVLFLLCGVGTVAAKNYRDSIIRVGEEGFTITSVQDAPVQAKNRNVQDYEPDMTSFLKMGGVFSIDGDIPDGGDPDRETLKVAEQAACEEGIVEYSMEDNTREYDSVEAFYKAENLKVVIPDKAIFGEEFTCENVAVIDEGWEIMVRLSNENVTFFMVQMNNSDCEGYSSGTSYGGKSANERSFTNSQGLNYVMFDTVDDEGEVISVHGVISVNGWDLSMTFEGFQEDVVENVLESLDLSVYF